MSMTYWEIVAIVALCCAAAGGLLTALRLLRDESPPWNIGIWHGRVGVAGVLLLAAIAFMAGDARRALWPAIALLAVTATAGVVLHLLIRKRGELPRRVVVGHAALAVMALAALLSGLSRYSGATPAPDGRTAIRLSPAERDLVLGEMRAFLESVQGITDGIARKDFAQVAESARRSGAAARHEVPASLIVKLPMPFKQLGFETHGKFDELASDAEAIQDTDRALSQLSALLNNCIACHAAYRIDPITPSPAP